MSDEGETRNNNTMNLDLNLGPGLFPATEDDPIELDDGSYDEDELRVVDRGTGSQRWSWLELRNRIEREARIMNLSQLLTSAGIQRGGVGGLHMGEGSVAAEERVPEVEKVCENKVIVVDDEAVGRDDEDGNGGGDEGSFYDCNICFELAKDPVITCCGHLYCWPCIYRWIHVHSDTNECPVCKGEVTIKSVTPIYGRGNNKQVPEEEDLTIRIPPRPVAKRVESRQTATFAIPVEEMIRRLGSRFDLTRDVSSAQDVENDVNLPDRSYHHLLNRIMTTRAIQREQALAPPENVVDLTQSGTASPDAVGVSELDARMARRYARNRVRNTSNPITPSMSPSDRVIEAYMRSHPLVTRRSGQSSPVDDRDSFSSIAAVMNSGSQSQTVDTAAEIDSLLSLSTSSSRRRNDASRASDVDSGDSRLPRRRRLN